MNVFRRYTLASLKKNKSRTWVTIIGIILSMALVTAVIEGAFSGIQFLIRSEEERLGRFHALYYSLTEDQVQRAEEQKNIQETALWKTIGFASLPLEESQLFEMEKPYMLLRTISNNFTDLVKVNLINGRFPASPDEIMIPSHLLREDAWTYKTGDTITLSVGKRYLDGIELNEFNPYEPSMGETFEGKEKTYTIVGVYERFDLILEDYSFPGYTVLTGWNEAEGEGSWLFFRVKDPAHFYDDMERYAVSDQWMEHKDLLRFNGSIRSRGIADAIYGFAVVLIFLIAFGSISLIYNSFAISVSERTKQFGILKSVGATNRQIRGSVIFEALLLGLFGILIGAVVGCVGIGVTLWALRDAFRMFSYGNVEMRLVVNPLGLLVAALVCMATTLISAWIPMRKASKISAIDAIRQTEDIKIKGKDVKVSKLTQKLFGFEGLMAAKNFKRNKKRYRATVVSLFLSVTLFISASSFCSYLTDLVQGVTSDDVSSDLSYYTVGEKQKDPDRLLQDLLATPGVTNGCYANVNTMEFYVDPAYLSSEFTRMQGSLEGDEKWYGAIAFLDDATYQVYCADNNIDPSSLIKDDKVLGILYNRFVSRTTNEKGNMIYREEEVLNGNQLPIDVYVTEIRFMEGYVMMEADEEFYYYFPDLMAEEAMIHWNHDEEYELDRSQAIALTDEEALQKTYFTVGAVSKLPLPVSSREQTVLVYPYSQKEKVMEGSGIVFEETMYYLNASDHALAYDNVEKYLKEQDMDISRLYDIAAQKEASRMLVTVVRVFSYGFIVLISLIAMANVFNTISTSIMLRRREFAMLKSIGLSEKGFRKMMNYECIIYGLKGLVFGLPAAVIMTYVIYKVTGNAIEQSFYIPWYSIVIAVGSVFAVVFATMLYATKAIKKDNPIDALKQENL